MDAAELTEPLARCRLFENLSTSEPQTVLQLARVRQVEPDAFFFQQGEPADVLYVLVQGKVRLAFENWLRSARVERRVARALLRLVRQTGRKVAGGVLVNDHDPKPLYYQFRFEREGQFTWDYLEEGPEVWQVRIGKTMNGGSIS